MDQSQTSVTDEYAAAMCKLREAAAMLLEFAENHGGVEPSGVRASQVGDIKRLGVGITNVARLAARFQLPEVVARQTPDGWQIRMVNDDRKHVLHLAKKVDFATAQELAEWVMEYFQVEAIALKTIRAGHHLADYSEHFRPTSPLAPWLERTPDCG